MPPLSAKKKTKKIPKAGSIHSISLKNFMTYTGATEFYPGKRFNVIFGPNGSGKSAIVTAITIGLGGDLKLLRRQTHLKDLVNNNAGKDERATIKIKLHQGEEDAHGNLKFHEIICNINRSGGLEYLKNGRRVDKKEIVRLAEQYKIQTSNLCQFLPQDVVREFPEMKPEQIFHNTLRAVGNTELLEMHDSLKTKQEEKKKCEEILATKSSTFVALKEKLEQKRELRSIVEKRNECEESISLLKKQVVRLEIVDAWKKSKHLEKKLNAAKVEKDELRVEKDDWQAKKNEVDKENQVFVEENRSLNWKIAEITRAMKSSKVAEIEGMIDAKTKSIENNQKSLISSTERISKLRKLLKNHENALNAINPESIDERFQACLQNQIRIEEVIRDIKQGIQDKENKLKIEESKVNDVNYKLKEMSTEDSKKLQILLSNNKDAYEGVLWLRKNKHMFKKPDGIYEPLMMYLKLTGVDKYAVQIESVIGNRDLEAFVCEDMSDSNLLMDMLRKREKLHRINVVHSPFHSGDSSKFRCPDWPSNKCKGKFLSQVIRDCPPAVMNHLCSAKMLHRTPVFDSDPGQIHSSFKKYFVNKMMARVITSRYGDNVMTRSTDLSRSSARYLQANVNNNEAYEDLKKNLAEYSAKRDEAKALIERLHASFRAESENLREAKTKMATLAEEKKKLSKFKREIDTCQRQIDSLKSGQDVAQINENLANERQELVRNLIEANKEELERIRTSTEHAVKIEVNNLKMQKLENQSMDVLTKYQDAVAKFEQKQDEEKSLETAFDNCRKDLAQKFKLVSWKAPQGGQRHDFPAELKQTIDDKCPQVLSAAKALLDSQESKLKNLPTVTQNQLAELETLEANYEKQRVEIDDLKRNARGLEVELKSNEIALVNGIQEMMSTINNRFRNLMEVMGFAGEVVLHKGNHELDFKHYGLQIMVKFRDRDALQPLTQSQQSGGEKSVTTALYIMALQEMTQVPFRCVDEINQGMDETNERRVWDLLVETANTHSAQFFYLAPKFPQQLDFGDGVHIIFCYNGDMDNKATVDVAQAVANTLEPPSKKQKK